MLATSVPPLMSFAKVSGIHAVPLGLVWAFAAGGKLFDYSGRLFDVAVRLRRAVGCHRMRRSKKATAVHSAGSSPASVRDCSHRQSAPTPPQSRSRPRKNMHSKHAVSSVPKVLAFV